MSATAVLAKLRAAGIAVLAEGGQLRLDAPANTLTPELLAAVKSCKAELLEMLKSPKGLSAVGPLFSPGAPGTQVHPIAILTQSPADGESYADREWDRFLACAVPTPNGLGLYDPSESPDMPAGVTAGLWDVLVATAAKLRQRRAEPKPATAGQ
ncbi:MAG: hypothetical protein IID34_07365 [Planctomycetes bacterium]|nr:hypothetical protein [Planctomycetota bacterium]